jgi:hypothetical protein
MVSPVFYEIGPVHVTMPLHFTETGAEDKARPPEVVVRFPVPADMNPPKAMPFPPAHQFVWRVGQDLAQGGALSKVKPGIVPGHGLKQEIEQPSFPYTLPTEVAVG